MPTKTECASLTLRRRYGERVIAEVEVNAGGNPRHTIMVDSTVGPVYLDADTWDDAETAKRHAAALADISASMLAAVADRDSLIAATMARAEG